MVSSSAVQQVMTWCAHFYGAVYDQVSEDGFVVCALVLLYVPRLKRDIRTIRTFHKVHKIDRLPARAVGVDSDQPDEQRTAAVCSTTPSPCMASIGCTSSSTLSQWHRRRIQRLAAGRFC